MPAKARPKSMLSFTHRKSSSSSQVKVDNLIETPQEKASHRVTSKADPTKAINEAQPGCYPPHGALTGNTESDRIMQMFKHARSLLWKISACCNIETADPDRSNPTRPRLERPLDTIRAFEAAIDGSYERTTPSRADTSDGMTGQSRRTSYYLGQRPQQRLGSEVPGGYYGNRMSMGRPDSTYVENNGGNFIQPGYGRRVNNRANSDPLLYGTNNQGVYPTHGYHQSHDTVASASGNESHNTDPWGNSTDPSSENSSIDRIQHGPKPDPAETYGLNGFGGAPQFQGPIFEEHGVDDRAYGEAIDYGQPQKLGNGFPIHSRNGVPPPPPPHASTKPNPVRVPIKLGNSPTKEEPSPNGNTAKRKIVTMESIVETPAKRRKTDIRHTTGDPAYDSANDSGDNLFDRYQTVDTILLLRASPGGRTSNSPKPLTPSQYITQPTQLLNRATPASNGSHKRSIIQVAASSPISKPSVPSPSPIIRRQAATLADRIAPPGTAFRPPVGGPKQNPVVDVSSDEDDIRFNRAVSSDEQSQSYRNADIKPSRFVQTIPRSANLSQFKEITSQAFYKPLSQSYTSQESVLSISGSLFDPERYKAVTGVGVRGNDGRVFGAAKAQDLADITLDDIEDFQIRSKVKRMHHILPQQTLAACKAALLNKRGNFDDAIEYLSALDDKPAAIDLTLSDNERSPQHLTKPTKAIAKQQAKAPAKSIHSKWMSTQALNRRETESRSSPPPKVPTPKPRKRLVQGRRKPTSPSPVIARRSSPVAIINSRLADTESQSDSAVDFSTDESELHNKVLEFFNTCTIEQLSDTAAVTEVTASTVLSYKPFKTLDVVRKISNESKATANKRTAKRPIGDKIVDSCIDMWRGYIAVDGLVQKCESLGKPLTEQMKKWGVDVYGAAQNGELDLTSFDQKSDAEASVKDSGIGTPTSTIASADEEGDLAAAVKRAQNTIFGQPPLMNENITLKDYQVVGVNWLTLLYENRLSCILADDMGLGKTCQVIAFLAHLFEQGKKADQKERAQIRHQIEQNFENVNVIVTTYGVAKAKDDSRFLRHLPLQVCVYDEGHLLKNRKSAAYEQLTRFKCSFRLLLTGTPLQNNLSELVSLLAFIMPQIFSEHSEDLDVIFSHKAKTSNESHAALLSQQRINRAKSIMAPFVLRRKKHQVLKHLPQKTRRVEYCDLSPNQSEIYNSEKARGLQVVADRAAGRKVGNETANVMMALRKASIHPLLFRRAYTDRILKKMARDCLKEDDFHHSQYDLCLEDMSVMMDYELHRFCKRYPSTMNKYRLQNDEWMDSGKVSKISDLLVEFKKNGDRVLVFSQFVMVMDILEDVMETLGMRFFRLDGQTKIDERQDMIDQFYADPAITVFLLSTKAGGAGINLACANKIIIFDSSFNPQDDIQAENRAHRVGQTREVEVIRLVSKGTIEEQIYALGQMKLALDDRVAGKVEAADMAAGDEKVAEKQGEKMVEELMLQQMKDEQGLK
ncbi:MAG: hypothetical protein Q9213_005074 [Squamulea squamosa]